MYQDSLNMGISEYAVRAALRELMATRGPVLTLQDIANEIRCSRTAVHGAVQRLEAAGEIRTSIARIAGRRAGLRYEFINGS